jgi:hypothetical protein
MSPTKLTLGLSIWNPRYLQYCRAMGRVGDPEAQLAQDQIDWPGGSMCGFILWHRERLQEACRERPELFFDGRKGGAMVDQDEYDKWLRERVKNMLGEGRHAIGGPNRLT